MKKADQTILAIETATPICSVVLYANGVHHEQRAEGRGVHSEKLFQFIQNLLHEQHLEISDLDVVLISAGPGSYTGLRIAASGVKGLLYDRDIPLLAINTLASYARGLVDIERLEEQNDIHAVIDARRSHLYHGRFQWSSESGLQIIDQVAVRKLNEVAKLISSNDVLIGTGISRLETLPTEVQIRDRDNISAKSLIQLYLDTNTIAYPGQLIKEVDLLEFDPRYYTSNQVAQKGRR